MSAPEVPTPTQESSAGQEAPRSPYSASQAPSGMEVRFYAEPRRYYELRSKAAADLLVPEEGWVEVPSVTNVLGVLDKPALPFWGMKIGVAGAIALHRGDFDGDELYDLGLMDTDEIVAGLTRHKLTVNHQRDKAGSRGVSVHDAFENWALLGHKPDPTDYPAEEFGYVAGLRYLLDAIPFEPEAAEVMVGSLEHGYAGRFDLRATLAEPVEIQVNRRRKVTLPAGKLLLDLKTSKGVYPSHELQLAAYEGASVECGYAPTDYQLVVQVGQEGKFDLRISRATTEDFLAVRRVYAVLDKLKKPQKAT